MIEEIPLKKLVLSPLNMRTNVEDATDIEQLADSIEEVGLLQPLVVHKVKGGKYGVIAGGRRLRALELIKYADPVPCLVRNGTDAQLLTDSVTENFIRKDARPYEIYEAFKTINASGQFTTEQLAEMFGLPLDRTRRILRLAHLHPEIFEAYKLGKLHDEDARAFAATEDQELQLSVFKEGLRGWQIKQALRVGADYRTLERVGRDVYEAAGGRIEEDLFSEEVRVIDTELLARLNSERLVKQKEEILAAYPNVTWGEAYPGGNEYSAKAMERRIYRPDEYEGPMLGVIDLDHNGGYAARFFKLEEGEKAPELGDKQPKAELTQKAEGWMKMTRHQMLRQEIFRHKDYPGRWRTDLYLYTMARKDGLTSVSFEEFVATTEDFKDETAAALFANRIGGHTTRATELAIEHIGHHADAHPRDLWTPDAEFFDLFKKKQLLDMAVDMGLDHDEYVNTNTPTKEIKERLLLLVLGKANAPAVSEAKKAAAQAWVPKWLKFQDARASVPAEQSEAEDEDLSSNEYPGAVTDPVGQFEAAA